MNRKAIPVLILVLVSSGLFAQTTAPAPAPVASTVTTPPATTAAADPSLSTVLPILATENSDAPAALSSIESLYNRLGSFPKPLRQYGYGATEASPSTISTNANVSSQYILGAGDQVTIMVWGDPVDLAELPPLVPGEINRSGGLFFAPVGLVPAAGLTLQDLERTLSSGLAKKYKRFELRLAVTQLRQFPMVVTGFVKRPGQVAVTAGYGIIEVLKAAGGVASNGSLRSMELRSRNGTTRTIDLYAALMEGQVPELSLREGDSLFVPALGKSAAVGGAVQRPGIYETLPRDTLSDLLRFAGGGLPDVQDSGFRLSLVQDGRLRVSQGQLSDTKLFGLPVENGTLLELFEGSLDVVNGVWVEGQVQSPGWFSLPAEPKLSKLLPQVGLKSDTDLAQGQLIRTNPTTFQPQLMGFVLRDILDGRADLTLFPRDRLRFFESNLLKSIAVAGEVENPVVVPWQEGLTLEAVLGQVRLKGDSRNLIAQVRDAKSSVEYYLRDRLTKRSTVPILIQQGASVQIVSVAAGLSLDTILASGEFGVPGVYKLTPGMRVSDLIAEAGKLTPKAFLPGIVLLRKSVLEGQKAQVDNVTKTLQDDINAAEAELAAAADPLARATATAKLAAKKDALAILVSGLEESLGRISLNAPEDQAAFEKGPSNVELEAGDRLYIPAVPNFVSVLGSVYNQSTQAFVAGKTVGDALSLSGGVTPAGDLGRAYLVRSSGLIEGTQKFQLFLVNTFQSVTMQPGDVVVVPPRDINTLDGWTFTKETLQLLATTVGLTANSLAIMKTLGVIK